MHSAYLCVGATTNELNWELPSGSFCVLGLRRAAPWDGWLERGLRQLPALFSFDATQLRSLTVSGSLNAVSPEAWDLVFDAFPALDALILDVKLKGGAFPTVITHSLSATSSGEEGEPCVRCPALATLDIEGWRGTQTDAEDILACLQARAAGGARKLVSLILGPDFATLEDEELGDMCADHWQELCRSVEHFEHW
ncbi:hypothetical protein TRAPUB_11569 [Trametes pubescens]|uniref:Uncharacterized protein n=1 Tax=Trametes pubescens TaxID=154538 RepID=A0A1M2VW99_TRAPU|nr:hypothetical protein TRAPUB_11569 [Trametes pubescens]